MAEDTGELQQKVAEMQHKEVNAEAFKGTVTRVEKSKRIKDDIRPSDGRPYSRQRVDEIRDVEMRSEQGDKAKETGMEELFMDARGYQETRFKMNWVSPDGGQSVAENLVMFVKQGQDGQIEYLTDTRGDKKPLALNADLYDARITSHKHPMRYDSDTFTIPRVDGRGAYTGVVTLMQDKP